MVPWKYLTNNPTYPSFSMLSHSTVGYTAPDTAGGVWQAYGSWTKGGLINGVLSPTGSFQDAGDAAGSRTRSLVDLKQADLVLDHLPIDSVPPGVEICLAAKHAVVR